MLPGNSYRLADAMWYDMDCFQQRVELLEKLVNEAKTADTKRRW